jgi:polar amino acid transport system substrate-binding protein
MPLVTVQPFRDSDAALAALRARRIDVYIHDAPTSWGIAGSPADADLFSLYRLLTVEELAWAVRKDDPQLLAALNDARDRLEQSGRLQAIQNFWIPVRVEVQ